MYKVQIYQPNPMTLPLIKIIKGRDIKWALLTSNHSYINYRKTIIFQSNIPCEPNPSPSTILSNCVSKTSLLSFPLRLSCNHSIHLYLLCQAFLVYNTGLKTNCTKMWLPGLSLYIRIRWKYFLGVKHSSLMCRRIDNDA